MQHILRTAVVLLVVVPLLQTQAQPLQFGEPFPLTNIRHGTTAAEPVVQTNGKDFFLFWMTENNLRVTRLVDGEHRGGRHVIPNTGVAHFAVTWTGMHFFLTYKEGGKIKGQLLDANAEPVGEPFSIVETQATFWAIASNGGTVILLYYEKGVGLHSLPLTAEGEPTEFTWTVAEAGDTFAVASNGTGFGVVAETGSGATALTLDDKGRVRSQAPLYSGSRRGAVQIAIGSDGRDYLAAWQVWEGGARAAHIRANGSVAAAVTLEPVDAELSSSGPVRLAWTGANWAVAYTKFTEDGETLVLRVAYVDAAAPEVVGFEDAGDGIQPALAAANGRALMAWRPEEAPAPVASLLPLGEHEAEPVTFASGSQTLIAVASAIDATLAVWGETVNGESVIRAGVRSADGDWVEREIAPLRTFTGVAASDGRDFVVITRGRTGDSARFVDATSRVTGVPVPLPIFPKMIAWSGSDYLLSDGNSIVRLSRSGTVSAPVKLGRYTALALASNGTDVMAVLIEPEPCPFGCPGLAGRPRFAQLGPNLLPIGEPHLMLPGTSTVITAAELTWDGDRFLAAWAPINRGVSITELPLGGGEPNTIAAYDSLAVGTIRLAPFEGGAAMAWREPAAQDGSQQNRVVVIRHDDTTTEFADAALRAKPFLAALSNGGIGVFGSVANYAAPDHGSSRVMLRVGGTALPEKPEPPQLTGIVRDGHIALAWTEPPQGVDGYRVEYRIGRDASWEEIDFWFDANDHGATINWPLQDHVPYQFRMRAVNDAGMSDYSEPVLVNVPRRRAVR